MRWLATVAAITALAAGVRVDSRSALLAQSERVPDSAVVNGVPQGIFVSRSLLTGRAVCLLFLSGGRITRAIPAGGLESFDWNRHRAAHGPDSGTWQVRTGQLVVQWGDGGVNQGPLTVNATGIEFYGKRYSKPVPVALPAIVGRWEAARGTAIAGGAGVNRVSELVIQADGRYQWASTTGGVVSGRAMTSDTSMSGTVSVKGLTIILRSDAGTTSSHTFLPAAGSPVSAFSIDADMFTRVGPAPSPAATPAPAVPAGRAISPAGTTTYQGLAFTMPSGWASGMQQGRFMIVPPNPTPESVVLVTISGAESLRGTFDDWFAGRMAADAAGMRVLQSAPASRTRSGGLDMLSAGRTVQDKTGGVILQIHHAISDGKLVGLAMVATASEAALKTHMPSVQSTFQSLRFADSDSAPAAPPSSSGAPSPLVPANKTTLTAADLVGSWGHSTAGIVNSAGQRSGDTISVRSGYSFAADGTYDLSQNSMINSQFIREKDTGRWSLQGNVLTIRSNTAGRSPKSYRILSYQVASDGTVFMGVLDTSYPLTQGNIGLYEEKWVRPRR